MKKRWIILIGAVLVFTVCQFSGDLFSHYLQQSRAKLVKSDQALLDQRALIPREGKEAVKINIYQPEVRSKANLPVVFHIHGGAFVGGDVDLLDSMSQRLAQDWQAVIIGVNYTKADIQPKEYAVQEITDAVQYVVQNAQDYQIDPQKVVLLGYSAGGYHVANSAIQLQKAGIPVAWQFLIYPFIADTANQLPTPENQSTPLASAWILAGGQDPLKDEAKQYTQQLQQQGWQAKLVEYPQAKHGFMEVNNPEYYVGQFSNDPAISDNQKQLARQAEKEIGLLIQQLK